MENEQQQIIQYKQDIQESMCKLYSKQYNKWLLVYDLLNGSYHEIRKSLYKNTITVEDIKEVIDNCNKIHDIFDYSNVVELILIS